VTSAFAGCGLPLALGAARLTERDPGPVAAIAPFRGRDEEVAARLGGALPPPGRVVPCGAGRLIWHGPGRALLVGAPCPDLGGLAAVTDQGDAIACALLEGVAASDALARLVPVDLRDSAFPVGATARTMLTQMTVTLTRLGPEAWEIMAFRSMAGTLVHEVGRALRGVAARLGPGA
jgi:sarcosine oxidase subunit gamma